MSNGEAAKPAAKGMAGLVVADSSVGFVDGANGILEYRGYDIGVLAENSTYEEVAYLLWNGRLPTANELADMKRQSRACRFMPPEVIAALRNLPKNADADGRHAHVQSPCWRTTIRNRRRTRRSHTSTRRAACWASLPAWWPRSSASAAARSR